MFGSQPKKTDSFWDFRGPVPNKGRHTHLGELLGPNLNELTHSCCGDLGVRFPKKKRKTTRSLILGLGLGPTLLDDDVGAMEPRQVPGLRAGAHGDASALRALRRRPETREGLARPVSASKRNDVPRPGGSEPVWGEPVLQR